MTPSEKAKKYAKDVVSGKLPNCKWVRLACQRFLDDLERAKSKDWPYRYDAAAADRFVNFLQKLPHVKGKWAQKRETYIAEPWQAFIDCNIFGWLHKKTGLRRFRKSYEKVPRKNGKSFRFAGRGVYMAFLDGEPGAEVYSGATSEKQAFEVFRPAWQMVDQLPELQEAFGISLAGNARNPGTLFRTEDMSKFETVIGNPGDGSSPHCALVDEYHEHDTDRMIETMETGMGAREQALLSTITTAGDNLAGPCFEFEQEMQRILERVVIDETIFCIMYGIDIEDPWDDESSLIKANPNFGVSVSPDFLFAQLAQARRSASKQNSFRTKHLNEWVGAKTAWMNMVAWMRQAKEMRLEDFKAIPCMVSTDLSSKKDITAVDVTFFANGDYFSFKKFFAPEKAADENEKYMEFVTSGHLELTDGFMLDQEVVDEYLIWLGKNFKVIDYSFDPWQADYMMNRLAKLKADVVKFPKRTEHFSEPMKQLEALVLDGKYFHDNNPVMNWMMANVAAKLNINDDIFPNKARPYDPKCKIDGVDVAIMSMGRWMVIDNKPPEKEYKMLFV